MQENNPTKWGPCAWYKFHKYALEYPDNPCKCDMENAIYFYQSEFLRHVNCDNCKRHYMQLLHAFPVKLMSRVDLFSWSVDIHNAVNTKIGKYRYTYNEAYQYWNNLCNPQCNIKCR